MFHDIYHVKIFGVGGSGIQALKQFQEMMPWDKEPWLELSGRSKKEQPEIPWVLEVEYWALDTDLNALSVGDHIRTLQLGPEAAGGKSTQADPELARRALIESLEAVLNALEGPDLLFILAGLGGGVGAGVTPLIAELAQGQLTLTYVTMPSLREAATTRQIAIKSLESLQDKGDSVVVVPVDEVDLSDDELALDLEGAYKAAHSLIGMGIRMIMNLAFSPHPTWFDPTDLNNILQKSGLARLGFGQAEGGNRTERATSQALYSSSIGNTIDQAKQFLVSGVWNNFRAAVSQEGNSMCGVLNAGLTQDSISYGVHCEEAVREEEALVLIYALGLPDIGGLYANQITPPVIRDRKRPLIMQASSKEGLNIAFIGPPGSGKACLVSSFYGYQQSPQFLHSKGYGLRALGSDELIQQYNGIASGHLPLSTSSFRSHSFDFVIKALEHLPPVVQFNWYDFSGDWWEQDFDAPISRSEAEEFGRLLECEVAFLIVDGERFAREGGAYLRTLLPMMERQFKRHRRIFHEFEVPFNYPSNWILTLSKVDSMPEGYDAEHFYTDVWAEAAEELALLAESIAVVQYRFPFQFLRQFPGYIESIEALQDHSPYYLGYSGAFLTEQEGIQLRTDRRFGYMVLSSFTRDESEQPLVAQNFGLELIIPLLLFEPYKLGSPVMLNLIKTWYMRNKPTEDIEEARQQAIAKQDIILASYLTLLTERNHPAFKRFFFRGRKS